MAKGQGLLSEHIQWMMMFAVVPIAVYNGQKGKDRRYLFYVFYPTHLLVLYLLAYSFSLKIA